MQPMTTARSDTAVVASSDERSLVERALVERAKRGDEEAFAALVSARLSSTLRSVTAILGDPADARDATQAIFIQVWRRLPGLRDPDAFSAWFGRIVVNTARSSLRSRRRRSIREIPVSALPDEGSIQIGSADHEARTDAFDRLERAFDRLSNGDRMILWLHHYEGLSLVELGARLDIAPKTVKSRLFTARRALERALEAETR
jgi:RNA polymerase sigma-70 factor (ECF subfamily)